MLRRQLPDFGHDTIQSEESEAEDTAPAKKTKKDKKKEVKHTPDFDARELELEEQVLGIADNILDSLPEKPTRKRKKKQKKSEEAEKKKWQDSDDEDVAEFERITPRWAGTFDDEKSEDSDEEVLKAHSFRSIASSSNLPSAVLDYKRVTDGNKEEPCKASLLNVEFHPKATALLTGGPDQTIRLFAIDGRKNRKIHSLFLERTPIMKCHFSRGGSEVIIGSKHKSFYVYDLEGNDGVTFRPKVKGLEISCMSKFEVSPDERFIAFLGKEGYIHLFSQKSKELIDSLRMNQSVKSVSFSKDGKYMYSFGNEGVVFVWDMDTRECIHSFHDEGCFDGTCVAASPDGNYIACGSKSGIVSVYDQSNALTTRNPKPIKQIKNLTTACTGAKFNSTSELLSVYSSDAEKAVRLVHLPSIDVLPNFPESFDHEMKLIKSLDFSPSSGYLAMGNNKGRCLLYRLEHYKQY